MEELIILFKILTGIQIALGGMSFVILKRKRWTPERTKVNVPICSPQRNYGFL